MVKRSEHTENAYRRDSRPDAIPSFKGFTAATSHSSFAKKQNRATGTTHEIALRRMLWTEGLRYRKNVKWLPGKPDIVFARQRVAIFCDGDFWHGRNWDILSKKLLGGHNSAYWVTKVLSNVQRDLRVNRTLHEMGWRVLRFWETDIKRSPSLIVRKIQQVLQEPPNQRSR